VALQGADQVFVLLDLGVLALEGLVCGQLLGLALGALPAVLLDGPVDGVLEVLDAFVVHELEGFGEFGTLGLPVLDFVDGLGDCVVLHGVHVVGHLSDLELEQFQLGLDLAQHLLVLGVGFLVRAQLDHVHFELRLQLRNGAVHNLAEAVRRVFVVTYLVGR